VHRSIWIGSIALLVGGGVVASAGCPDDTNTGYLPVTAIQVDITDLLNGANLTCGTGPGDVAMYAAVVNFQSSDTQPSGTPTQACTSPPGAPLILAGGLYPCYAAGPIANLPLPNDGGALPDGGHVDYAVQILMFTQAEFAAHQKEIEKAIAPGTKEISGDGGVCSLPFSWAATCTATEQNNIEVNTACPGGVVLGPTPAGGGDSAASDGEVEDGGDDGGVEDAGTEDAGIEDAGKDGGKSGDAASPKEAAAGDAPSEAAADAKGQDAPSGLDGGADGPTDGPPPG
jgi:hypothetical protein